MIGAALRYLCLAVLVGLFSFGLCARVCGAQKPKTVLGQWKGDLDGDGVSETVTINYSYMQNGHPMGGDVVVRRVGKQKVFWRQGKLNPWKLQVADVDGDGAKEVVLGVWKKSPKDPVMARRVFIYSWNGHRLLPKWLSSRLSRRFTDFALADVDKDGLAELFALEIMPGGKHRISEYRWRSFGCDWLGCTGDITGATGLSAKDGGIEITRSGSKPLKLDLSTIQTLEGPRQ